MDGGRCAISLTGDALIAGLGRYLGQPNFYFPFATTAAGSATSVVSTTLARWDDDALIDRFLRITKAAHAGIYQVRAASDFTGSTGTVTVAPGFGTAPGDACDMEMFGFDPAQGFIALDKARIEAYPALGRLIYDDTITADGLTSTFDIPATIRRGPMYVLEETPLEAAALPWNFIAKPLGESTTGYTATGTTASTVTRNERDPLIPKYEQTCTKLVTAGSQAATYTLPIANAENGLTAALGADREMTYGRWVYCTEASKVRLGIEDDSGASYSSSYHQGKGWELLTVEDTIVGNNATTLSAIIDIASTASPSTIYVERGWWYYGKAERVTERYNTSKQHRIRRDDTTQQFHLDFKPKRGYQIRCVGRETLSALGTTVATQATNTMELDEESAELLYATAAEILLRQQGLAVDDVPGLAAKIALVKPRLDRLHKRWAMHAPTARLKSMWAS